MTQFLLGPGVAQFPLRLVKTQFLISLDTAWFLSGPISAHISLGQIWAQPSRTQPTGLGWAQAQHIILKTLIKKTKKIQKPF